MSLTRSQLVCNSSCNCPCADTARLPTCGPPSDMPASPTLQLAACISPRCSTLHDNCITEPQAFLRSWQDLFWIALKTSSHMAQVIVHTASADVYAASIDKKIAMKVGYGNWSPTDNNCQVGQRDWVLATSGPNFAIWEAIF